jgi:hypothetical protein
MQIIGISIKLTTTNLISVVESRNMTHLFVDEAIV